MTDDAVAPIRQFQVLPLGDEGVGFRDQRLRQQRWRPDSALFNQCLKHRVSAILVELDTDLSPKLVG